MYIAAAGLGGGDACVVNTKPGIIPKVDIRNMEVRIRPRLLFILPLLVKLKNYLIKLCIQTEFSNYPKNFYIKGQNSLILWRRKLLIDGPAGI